MVRTIGLAVAIAAVCLAVAAWSRATGGPWQTQLFVTLAVAQLILALALRPGSAWRGCAATMWVPVAVLANLALLLAGVYLSGLAHVLGTEAIAPEELAVAAVAGCVPAALLVLTRVLGRVR